ncbi:MAG: TIGR03571 family LLM class oxidoreductase [Bacteroidota bacterium]
MAEATPTAERLESAPFRPLNRGYRSVFQPGRLTLGLVVPIETYAQGPVPAMERHAERVRLAERLGFAAVWLRDVPFNVPSFGDAGQPFDPFVYLGLLAGQTERIALGVASVILPLRHPAHVARAAASADVLSGGRLLLGIASGDRPAEYPAFGQRFEARGERFREAYAYLRRIAEPSPSLDSPYGRVGGGIDLLPKPVVGQLPLLITGGSRQAPSWVAAHGDGWMTYPRAAAVQAQAVRDYRALIPGTFGKPVMQPLYVDLDDDPDAAPRPLHLGMRSGMRALAAYLGALETAGVNHVALNLRFNRADTETTLRCLADDLLPQFPTLQM